ncbi:MAG: nucleotide exchange factor GrpE, partial [Corynebacterium casei]
MTQPNGMPENPGDPEQTDPEATSADRAEAA